MSVYKFSLMCSSDETKTQQKYNRQKFLIDQNNYNYYQSTVAYSRLSIP